MKISLEWLKEKGACGEGVAWFKAQKQTDGVDVLSSLIKAERFNWANWTIVRIMERKQYLAYAIYAAKQVLDIFEKKYPKDNRPRKAIEAAQKCLENDTSVNRKAAAYAAAAYAAAYAAYAAAYAAYAAAYAAYAAAAYAAAAYAAADVAYVAYVAYAAYAAYAADAAAAARRKMKIKILEYGISLLEKETVSNEN